MIKLRIQLSQIELKLQPLSKRVYGVMIIKNYVLNPLSCLAKKRYESYMSMYNKVLED